MVKKIILIFLFLKIIETHYYSKYNLPGRKYLGPTTTDNILAFVMVNFI